MSRTTTPIRLFCVLATILLLGTQAFSYEEDTHFLMTYVICRSAGFADKDALIVAAVDQGMDDSDETNAHDGPRPQITEEWLWHALDKNGEMHAIGIVARRDALFQAAMDEKDPRNRLIRLGIFFHYQQDTWAHRHHETDDHLSQNDYTTFDTPVGHAAYGPQPDRPPLDPVAALMCLEDGIVHASDFLNSVPGSKPNIFFKGYTPEGGKVDATWKDKRKGKFFTEIDLGGLAHGSARLFLASLIYAQIDVYQRSRSPNILFEGKQTADKADLDKVRAALQNVCTTFKRSVGTFQLPTETDKVSQGFTNMTTQQLLTLTHGSL